MKFGLVLAVDTGDGQITNVPLARMTRPDVSELATLGLSLSESKQLLAKHRKGLPISSSIAESAVNQVVSHRMAKKRQMRWTDEGAHCMAQVRVAI